LEETRLGRIKISGKTKLNITADGLLKTPLRLAFVIAIIARSWLYGCGINLFLSGKCKCLVSFFLTGVLS